MATVTPNRLKNLLDKGIINEEQYETMLQSKKVSSRPQKLPEIHIPIEDGETVVPKFYFEGSRGKEHSDLMNEFRVAYKELVTEFAETHEEVQLNPTQAEE